jgi:hypothetical protein
MTSNVTEATPQEKKIYSEGRGKYSLLDGSKVYQFEFPINASLEENFSAISFIKDKLFETLKAKEAQEKEKEKEKKKEELDDVIEEAKKVAQP